MLGIHYKLPTKSIKTTRKEFRFEINLTDCIKIKCLEEML